MAQATEAARANEQLRFVDADELGGWNTSLEGVVIMSTNDEVVGGLDGLLVDGGDRPMFLAMATRTEPPRRYLLPIGTTWFDETTGVIRTDATNKTLNNYPEFDPAQYQHMSSEESFEYERRVLRACCPETAAPPGSRMDHYNRKEFQDPGWLKRPNTSNKDTSRPRR